MTQFATPRPEPKRDHNGRYLLNDPATGKERAYTRVTTFANALEDLYTLGEWEKRMVAKGIALRSDLYALAAATPLDHKKKLDQICKDAKEAAEASSGSNLGTALHGFTEQVDRGEDVKIPRPWDADVAAYQAELARHDARVYPQWIERVVIIPRYGLAGTLDRIYGLPGGRLVVGDVKTGKVEYSWTKTVIQLALYANAEWIVDLSTGKAERLPELDQDLAVVMHLPPGKAQAELWDVDIKSGWEAAYICRVVRDWRKRKDLAVRRVPDAEKTVDPAEQLTDRINNALDMYTLEQLWRDNRQVWEPHHTTTAVQRRTHINTLNSAGTPGGTQETEGARV